MPVARQFVPNALPLLRERVPDAVFPSTMPSTCATPPVSRVLSMTKEPFWIGAPPSRIVFS